MASTAGNGIPSPKFDAGSVMPHTADNVAGYQPSAFASKLVGGKKNKKTGGKQQNGGSLAYSVLKGGKRKSKRASKKRSNKRKTARRGKKTIKNMLKGLFGIFKK